MNIIIDDRTHKPLILMDMPEGFSTGYFSKRKANCLKGIHELTIGFTELGGVFLCNCGKYHSIGHHRVSEYGVIK